MTLAATPAPPTPAADPDVRTPALVGLVAVGCCTALLLALHLLAPAPGPAHTMISNYALGEHRPLFDLGVLTLAAGSAAVLAALLRGGLVRPYSAASVLLGTWCAGMVLVVAFPTTASTAVPTVGAVVHAVASVAAFACLPLGALRLAGTWGAEPGWRRAATAVRATAALSLLLLLPVLGGLAPGSPFAVAGQAGVPFGLLQRALAATDVVLLALLAAAALRRSGRAAAPAR